jgi:hypothetical protein
VDGNSSGEKMAAAMAAVNALSSMRNMRRKQHEMLNILQLLQMLLLRIDDFCPIYNNWWMLKCGTRMQGGQPSTPTPIL